MKDPAPPSSGSEYASTLRAVMERAAEVDSGEQPAPPRRTRLTSGPVVAALAVAFVSVIAWNVVRWRARPVAPPPDEARASLDVSLLAATQAVEAYRAEHGTLPASLQELGFPEGMRLEATDTGFVIVARVGDSDVRFDGAEGIEGVLERLGVRVEDPE